MTDEPFNFFWAEDGWCVDLREYRNYPVYGEGDWTLRTDNAGIGCRALSFFPVCGERLLRVRSHHPEADGA